MTHPSTAKPTASAAAMQVTGGRRNPRGEEGAVMSGEDGRQAFSIRHRQQEVSSWVRGAGKPPVQGMDRTGNGRILRPSDRNPQIRTFNFVSIIPGRHPTLGLMKPILPLLSLLTTLAVPAHAAEPATVSRDGSQIMIRAGEREILRYQAEPGELPPGVAEIYKRGGYIQSVHTPGGRLVTDDFPADHRHHHGIWKPWTKTRFEDRSPDFWNMGQGSGRVEFVAVDEIWENDGKAGFRARHRFVDLTTDPPKTVLEETWEIAAWAGEGGHVIDFTSIQKCATASPLVLPAYHYGGLGFRGHTSWGGAENCRFLTASGLTDRTKVNTSRERWCWVGGTVDGGTCGVTVLCHSTNFRFPQPIRAHPNEPFFCYAPQQLGEMAIRPGDEYTARYRFIVADGEPDAAAAEAAWRAYSGD